MKGIIYITGEIGVDCTLLDVIKQVKNQSSATEYLVKIDSYGGFVDSGKDIYNYLVNLGKPVTTYTTKAYSIASRIFMAGSVRIIPEGAENAILIHLPWMETVGNSIELSNDVEELKTVENELVNFYSNLIDIDKDTVHSLLKNETFLSATQALELGFATLIQPELKAVAKLHNKEKNELSLMDEISKKVDSIYNFVFGKSKTKAELILQDATGVELVFPELDASESVSVDAIVTVDGQKATGEYLMPDNTTIVTNEGVVTEIKPAEEIPTEEPAVDESMDSKDETIANLQSEIENLKLQLSELNGSKASVEKLVEIVEESAKQNTELMNKYNVLAKQIGSDFTPTTTEINPTIKSKDSEEKTFSIKRK